MSLLLLIGSRAQIHERGVASPHLMQVVLRCRHSPASIAGESSFIDFDPGGSLQNGARFRFSEDEVLSAVFGFPTSDSCAQTHHRQSLPILGSMQPRAWTELCAQHAALSPFGSLPLSLPLMDLNGHQRRATLPGTDCLVSAFIRSDWC